MCKYVRKLFEEFLKFKEVGSTAEFMTCCFEAVQKMRYQEVLYYVKDQDRCTEDLQILLEGQRIAWIDPETVIEFQDTEKKVVSIPLGEIVTKLRDAFRNGRKKYNGLDIETWWTPNCEKWFAKDFLEDLKMSPRSDLYYVYYTMYTKAMKFVNVFDNIIRDFDKRDKNDESQTSSMEELYKKRGESSLPHECFEVEEFEKNNKRIKKISSIAKGAKFLQEWCWGEATYKRWVPVEKILKTMRTRQFEKQDDYMGLTWKCWKQKLGKFLSETLINRYLHEEPAEDIVYMFEDIAKCTKEQLAGTGIDVSDEKVITKLVYTAKLPECLVKKYVGLVPGRIWINQIKHNRVFLQRSTTTWKENLKEVIAEELWENKKKRKRDRVKMEETRAVLKDICENPEDHHSKVTFKNDKISRIPVAYSHTYEGKKIAIGRSFERIRIKNYPFGYSQTEVWKNCGMYMDTESVWNEPVSKEVKAKANTFIEMMKDIQAIDKGKKDYYCHNGAEKVEFIEKQIYFVPEECEYKKMKLGEHMHTLIRTGRLFGLDLEKFFKPRLQSVVSDRIWNNREENEANDFVFCVKFMHDFLKTQRNRDGRSVRFYQDTESIAYLRGQLKSSAFMNRNDDGAYPYYFDYEPKEFNVGEILTDLFVYGKTFKNRKKDWYEYQWNTDGRQIFHSTFTTERVKGGYKKNYLQKKRNI